MSQPIDPPQAPSQTIATLAQARDAIDASFGQGYAAANPQVVAAFLQAAAIENAVLSGQAATREVLATIKSVSRETNETLLKLKPRIFG